MADTEMHQQLFQSNSEPNKITVYGSNETIPNENPKAHYIYLVYLALILSAISFILLIFLVIMVFNIQSNADSALNMSNTNSKAIGDLSINSILSQFSFEQRIRSSGDSGITHVRQSSDGDEAYSDGIYTNGAVLSIHDHSNYVDTMGMGEFEAVLNGVEFITRHNDYKLEMPSTTSMEYHETEPISFPNVPPEVLLYGNDIDGQIQEMQEWFRAFKTQNKSHRYYPDYFKPILCYLEGTWITESDDGVIDEQFDSDRHFLAAETYKELNDRVRYLAMSGRKDALENLGYFPSSIRHLDDDNNPIRSNWEYRIACHPLSNDVPTDRFRVSSDLSVQLLSSPLTRDELYYSRRARFELATYINRTSDDDDDDSYPNGYWLPGIRQWNYFDYLMEQIPGKDNYLANLTDDAFVYGLDDVRNDDGELLNIGYYNRYFTSVVPDAMGSNNQRRSYSDRYLFVAKNTQTKVTPSRVEYNETIGTTNGESIINFTSRWSYAIPLEIIYTTPLSHWNPYNITYIENISIPSGSGDCSNDPWTGWKYYSAYFTPKAFYESMQQGSAADTARSDRCSLDSNGISQEVYPSGHYVVLPSIGNNVGWIRQRYPIPPIHYGATLSFKEIKATQAILLDDNYDDPINGQDYFGNDRDRIYGFDLNVYGGSHSHIMNIPGWKVNMDWYNEINDEYYNGSNYKIISETNTANGHEHVIILTRWRENINTKWNYIIDECSFGIINNHGEFIDGLCEDGHNSLIR